MCTPTDFKNMEYRKLRIVTGTKNSSDAMRDAFRDGWRQIADDPEWARFEAHVPVIDPVFIFTFERPLGNKK